MCRLRRPEQSSASLPDRSPRRGEHPRSLDWVSILKPSPSEDLDQSRPLCHGESRRSDKLRGSSPVHGAQHQSSRQRDGSRLSLDRNIQWASSSPFSLSSYLTRSLHSVSQLSAQHFSASIDLIRAALETLVARGYTGYLCSPLSLPEGSFIGQLEQDWNVDFEESLTFSFLVLVRTLV